jgi:hypothetical protein
MVSTLLNNLTTLNKFNMSQNELPNESTRFKMSYKVCQICVQAICILVAIVLTCLCVHKYCLDDDLAEINFQTFNEKEHAVYPSITLCFMGPNIFLPNKLKRFGKGINETNYSNFLQGLIWNETMRDIDFDEVTINIHDYLEGVIISSAGDNARHCSPNFQKILKHFSVPGCINGTTHHEDFPSNTFNFHVSYRDFHTKCFSMDVPFKEGTKLNRLRLFIRSQIFPQTINEQYMFEKNFGVFLHYPGQLFRSPIRKLYKHIQNESLLKVMKFKMQNIEVLIRRNKASQKCNELWKKDDNRILDKIVRAIKCEPTHWKLDSSDILKNRNNVTICSNKKKMQLFSRHSPLAFLIPNINFLNNLSPPCHDVTQSLYEYKEEEWSKEEFKGLDVEANFFEINLAFPSSVYKEIVQIRAYGLSSLVGYIGGYIGMFLGIGLSQLPGVLMNTIKGMKKSKPKLEGTFRKYTIKRRSTNTRCYNNSSVTLKKQTTNTCQQVLECSSALNGQEGHLLSIPTEVNQVSSEFKPVKKSCLKPRKDVITSAIDDENKIQTREDLQMRISKLEDRLERISNSLNDKIEDESKVA